MNSAITAASNTVSERLSDMLGTFAPLKEEGLTVDSIMLDLISMGFSLSMSPMWNKGKSALDNLLNILINHSELSF